MHQMRKKGWERQIGHTFFQACFASIAEWMAAQVKVPAGGFVADGAAMVGQEEFSVAECDVSRTREFTNGAPRQELLHGWTKRFAWRIPRRS